MKAPDALLSGSKHRIICALLCIASVSYSVHPQSNADAKKPASNAPPVVVPPPQSLFVLPHTQKEGKDPFYPKSMRPYGHAPVVTPTTAAPVVVTVDLKLKAITGLPSRRLALINNHTFGVGEEYEVISNQGRTPVRCLEIRADSVIIEVGSERRELRMRSTF